MKKCLSVLFVALLLCGGLVFGASAAPAAPVDITAKFTDPAFRAAVYEEIGKTAPAPIYDTDVATVTHLFIEGDYEFVVTVGYVSSGKIKNLNGIEYFTSLTYLDCSGHQLTSLPSLPSSLVHLVCGKNQLTTLPRLPSGLLSLFCDWNQLTSLPSLPSKLQTLYCNSNFITGINVTGLSLDALYCPLNNMTSESAVKGFYGSWGGDFVFQPQNGLNRTALNATLAQAKAIKKGNYTDASWKALQTAITGAEAAAKYLHLTQELIDGYTNLLQKAIDELIEKISVTKTALNAKLAQAKAIKKGNYTDASWKALQTAIANAQAVANSSTATQAQVDAQVTALQKAIDELTEKVTKTALNAKLAQAKAIQTGNYTDDTWNALQTAIANAQAVANSSTATQAQVDAQVTALQNAIDGLRENTAPPAQRTFWQWIMYIFFFGWIWMK